MARIAILLADGFETIEALAPADVCRRGGQDVALVTVNAEPHVTSAQNVGIDCDATLDTYDFATCDLIVLPGGLPGTTTLRATDRVCELARDFMANRKLGSICAAPSILAELDLLEGRTATCYPGFEGDFPAGVRPEKNGVYRDGNLVTASGPGFAVEFGLVLLELLTDKATADGVASGMLIER